MVPLARAQRLTLPLGPAIGMAGGVLIALICLVIPASSLEGLVGASGIPAIIAAAEPPLGFTARIALGLMLGGGFAGFVGVGLTLLGGDRPFDFSKAAALLRRGDVHPDGPPRPPLFAARDLGTPFLEVKAQAEPEPEPEPEQDLDLAKFKSAAAAIEPFFASKPEPAAAGSMLRVVEQPLPRDLDRPLAGYDLAALPAEPRAMPEPVAPLAPRPALIDPGDRFETFELTPAFGRGAPSLRETLAAMSAPQTASSAPVADRVVTAETEATVNDLLARLEQGVGPEPGPTSEATGSLADTLEDLRRLATGVR